MPTHYDIELHLDGENAMPGVVPDLLVGDTVRYFSNDGKASVNFAGGSPFQEQLIGDDEIVVVQNAGTFRGQCFITKDHEKFGWKKDPSPSGADHQVKEA